MFNLISIMFNSKFNLFQPNTNPSRCALYPIFYHDFYHILHMYYHGLGTTLYLRFYYYYKDVVTYAQTYVINFPKVTQVVNNRGQDPDSLTPKSMCLTTKLCLYVFIEFKAVEIR